MPYKYNPFTGELDITGGISSPPVSFVWNVVTTATYALVANTGNFANRSESAVTFTLPSVSTIGDIFKISAKNANGFIISQNANQYIQIADVTTTTGVGGSLASSKIGDFVEIVCTVANIGFIVTNIVGNLTVV